MPISENILEEIKRLNISDKEKMLMNEILVFEDTGSGKYKQEYIKIVDEYIDIHDDKER